MFKLVQLLPFLAFGMIVPICAVDNPSCYPNDVGFLGRDTGNAAFVAFEYEFTNVTETLEFAGVANVDELVALVETSFSSDIAGFFITGCGSSSNALGIAGLSTRPKDSIVEPCDSDEAGCLVRVHSELTVYVE